MYSQLPFITGGRSSTRNLRTLHAVATHLLSQTLFTSPVLEATIRHDEELRRSASFEVTSYFRSVKCRPHCLSSGSAATLSLAGIAGSNSAGGRRSASCECCVLSARGLCNGPIPRPEESYWMCPWFLSGTNNLIRPTLQKCSSIFRSNIYTRICVQRHHLVCGLKIFTRKIRLQKTFPLCFGQLHTHTQLKTN
jgi:hypothetical protein